MPLIIKKNIGGEEVNAVNARELHARLGSKRQLTDWIKQRIEQYGFTEGVDYLLHKFVKPENGGLQGKDEYFISLDMAKELSMVENNEAGKIARRYFIECEKVDKTRGLKNGLRDMPKVEPVVEKVVEPELVDDVIDAEPEQTHSNDLAVFNFENHTVRTVIENGQVWFVAKDVCDALGHGNSRMVCSRLDDDERRVHNMDSKPMTLINESGLYSLILTSRKDEAKKFKKWVTSEVLPTIRKTGSYTAPNVETKNDTQSIDWLESPCPALSMIIIFSRTQPP